MLLILTIFIAGILIGWLLKSRKASIGLSAKLTLVSVLALLFLLGYAAGSNNEVVKNFSDIGLKAIVISLLSTIGSILAVMLFSKLFLKAKPAK